MKKVKVFTVILLSLQDNAVNIAAEEIENSVNNFLAEIYKKGLGRDAKVEWFQTGTRNSTHLTAIVSTD